MISIIKLCMSEWLQGHAGGWLAIPSTPSGLVLAMICVTVYDNTYMGIPRLIKN